MWLPLATLLLTLVPFALVAQSTDATEIPVVHGTLTDAIRGGPLADYRIGLRDIRANTNAAEAATAADGSFRLDVAPGSYIMVCWYPPESKWRNVYTIAHEMVSVRVGVGGANELGVMSVIRPEAVQGRYGGLCQRPQPFELSRELRVVALNTSSSWGYDAQLASNLSRMWPVSWGAVVCVTEREDGPSVRYSQPGGLGGTKRVARWDVTVVRSRDGATFSATIDGSPPPTMELMDVFNSSATGDPTSNVVHWISSAKPDRKRRR